MLCYILVLCALVYLFVLCVACLTVFGETMRNMFWCDCNFVVECYGCV